MSHPEPPIYSELCNAYGLQQALIFPLTPEPLIFALNPDDINFNSVDAGKTISIKYQTFVRQLSAFIPEINIDLYGVSVGDLKLIIDFATNDFLNNVRSTGLGSITLFYRGEQLDNLYIRPPIQAPTSVFNYWETTPTEMYDKVSFTLIHPEAKWY